MTEAIAASCKTARNVERTYRRHQRIRNGANSLCWLSLSGLVIAILWWTISGNPLFCLAASVGVALTYAISATATDAMTEWRPLQQHAEAISQFGAVIKTMAPGDGAPVADLIANMHATGTNAQTLATNLKSEHAIQALDNLKRAAFSLERRYDWEIAPRT